MLVLGGVIGYLIGSIPFAYIITRAKTGMDLRRFGSRNIGATNAFEVTGQRSIGATVLTLDLLKGLIPVFVFESLGLSTALLALLPALVLGHCYPIWLKFHGGRGLATIAGAFSVVNPAAVLLWCVSYLLFKKLRDNVHVAAALASMVVLVFAWALPSSVIEWTTLAFSGLRGQPHWLSLSTTFALLIVLLRHIEPLVALRRTPSNGET